MPYPQLHTLRAQLSPTKSAFLSPLLGICLVFATSAPAFAQFGKSKQNAFTAPGRLFSVNVPASWQIALTNDPYTIHFLPKGPGDAYLSVRRIEVPRGANPRQLALGAIERRLTKMPGFKLTSKRNVVVGGVKGTAVVGTYLHQGNIQYPRALEEIFLVAGAEAFIFHFECFEPQSGAHATPLNGFYTSFIPRPAAIHVFDPGTSDDIAFPPIDNVKDADKVPF